LDSFLTGTPPNYSKPTWLIEVLRKDNTPTQ
jgi:hypothetical protein